MRMWTAEGSNRHHSDRSCGALIAAEGHPEMVEVRPDVVDTCERCYE